MNDRVEIHASIGKLLLLIAGAFGFVVVGVALITSTDWLGAVIGLIAVIFFGFCMVVAIWRLFTLRGPVVTLTSQGIRDIRVAPEYVAWKEIEDISTWRHGGQKVMVLRVPDATWNRLTLTAIASRTRGMNQSLGADGLAVSSTELKTSHDALVQVTSVYWNKRKNR